MQRCAARTGDVKDAYGFHSRYIKTRDHLKNLGVDGSTLSKWVQHMWTEFISSG
jgi:hypothetical protein